MNIKQFGVVGKGLDVETDAETDMENFKIHFYISMKVIFHT